MGDLLTPETLDLFLFFVVPGFVAMKLHDLLVPSETRNWGDSLIEVVSYSMLNLAVFWWLMSILWREGVRERHSIAYTLGVFLVVVVAPAGWAALTYLVRQSHLLRRFVLHPSPTAWDFFFGQRRSAWVLCHLKTGELLGGLFSGASAASSFPHEGDIFLEEVWETDQQGRFVKRIDQTAGAIINKSECTHIELFAIGKE